MRGKGKFLELIEIIGYDRFISTGENENFTNILSKLQFVQDFSRIAIKYT
jgi:hypothetical protein